LIDVFESDNLSLTLFGVGHFSSFTTQNILFKVDSIGEGFCNTYDDSVQFGSPSFQVVSDAFVVTPYAANIITYNCSSSISTGITVTLCPNPGVPIYEESIISVYPNPIIDHLSISLSENFNVHLIEVYNSLGQKVLLKEIYDSQDRELTIPISLPQGIYYGRLISVQKIYTFNFTVAK